MLSLADTEFADTANTEIEFIFGILPNFKSP